LPGIGWNTFDYVLRDVHQPDCLSLFKVDSTNEALIEKMFGFNLNGNRRRYRAILAEIGILDEYRPTVINMAIYASTSRSCLEYLRSLKANHQGGFMLDLDAEG
jgi:hypothetical protein